MLNNIKKVLHDKTILKHYHAASNMEFTITTLSLEKRNEIASIVNSNPILGQVFTQKEKERIENIFYLANGIQDFSNIEDKKIIAEKLLDKKGYGESNKKLLTAIREINPSTEEKIKDLFVVMAFSPDEVNLINAVMDVDAKKELCLFLSDKENIIEAISFCKEFFMVLGSAVSMAEEHQISIQHSLLTLAKSVLIERNLMPKSELVKLPDMPKPKVNVNVNQ